MLKIYQNGACGSVHYDKNNGIANIFTQVYLGQDIP